MQHTSWLCLTVALLLVAQVSMAPVIRPSTTTKESSDDKSKELLKFMQKFGYLPEPSGDVDFVFTSESISEAIREMQKFGGVPQTGELDNKTRELMMTPRCGVPDVRRKDSSVHPLSSTRTRSKRFVIGAEGWKKRTITYFIANWSPKIGEQEVAIDMQKAFQVWADYSRLKFVRVNDPRADIIVAFGRGPHGDGYAFDGPGNILAHAFYPYEMSSFGGDIHFDDDEKWKLKLDGPFDDGVDFLSVAVHELGHSIGLAHSPVSDSVMFPYFKGYNPNPPQLGYDDILAMYQLYISRPLIENSAQEDTPHFVPDKREETVTEKQPDREDSSEDSSSDSSSERSSDSDDSNEVTHTFDGDYDTVDSHRTKFGPSTPVFSPSRDRGEAAEPSTEPVTPAAPIIDACEGKYDAVSVIRSELFVFKKNLVWRLRDRGEVETGYPVPITQMFYQLPSNLTKVDAVYERPTDGNILIFSGTKYWVTDGNRLMEGSPKPLTSLGLPGNLKKIDAIMVWGKNQKTYIFSGDDYWRYDEYARQMEPGYPTRTSERWRGVPSPIDTAMTYTDGMTYFFKDSKFWRFDNARIQTDERYPLPAPQWWLNCPEEDEY